MTPVSKDCICCMAPAKTRCAGCQRVYFCSQGHQKAAWGLHKYLCKDSDLDAFRQPPLDRTETDIYASTRKVNVAAPETALIGLEPYGTTGSLASVLRKENPGRDAKEYVWSMFEFACSTATPARRNLIISLVRYNNYKNAGFPGNFEHPLEHPFSSHKAFCKTAVLVCDPDGPGDDFLPIYTLPDATTNEALRQTALAYYLMHTYQRAGYIMTADEERLIASAAARIGRIADELRERKDPGAQRIKEVHFFWDTLVMATVRGTLARQRATGNPGPGDGKPWRFV